MPVQLRDSGNPNFPNELPPTMARLPLQNAAVMEIDSEESDMGEELDAGFDIPPASPDELSWPSSLSSQSSRASTSTPAPAPPSATAAELGPNNLRRLTSIQPSQLRYPKSKYDGYIPPLPVREEQSAVKDLLQEFKRLNPTVAKSYSNRAALPEQEFVEFELSDFVMYLPEHRHHAYEIWSLQDLANRISFSTLLFDGILSVGNVQHYVQAVPFNLCSIGNYGEDIHDVGDNIWIRSMSLANSDIYYRLKTPAPEYARFYHGFLWLAGLAKHFVDYCQWSVAEKKQVSIYNFRSDFSQWIQKRHGKSSSFQLWYQKYHSNDFRHAVAANIQFLFKESVGIDNRLRKQPIWNELLEKDVVPMQEPKEPKTVVTPYVYDCFEHLRFGHLLKSVVPTKEAPRQDLRVSQIKALNHPASKFIPVVEIPLPKVSNSLKPSEAYKNIPRKKSNSDILAERKQKIATIRVGDVLSVTKDGEGSVWKDEASRWKAADDCWYIYVQGVHDLKNGSRSFDGLWLYKSSDTCCAKMKYPFPNEMFLSDNCTCSHGRIPEDEVLDVVTVDWHGSPPKSRKGLFVRQTYLENDKFETLKDEHKICGHLRHRDSPITPKQKHRVGQTVLVCPPGPKPKHALEPYEIVAYVTEEGNTMAVLRQLLRRNEIAGQSACRPNELVYSDRTYSVNATKIERTCLVRFYSEADVAAHSIPTPYDRDGTGNAFYITTRLVEDEGHQELKPIHNDLPQTLIQGFNPTDAPRRKMLRGLDLYCGGGNFGRGLEEGGALHNEWAVDYARVPMHSYYANLKDPSSTKLFCGSVDDQLYQALHGNPTRSDLIPMPGEVDFISAGSPCQGFSALNSSKNNDKGLKNQSLVASVAAYIDFYRPKYGLLENVMTMAQKGLGRDEDVLSQLICAIVGMGYQLQLFVLDAWSLGSPQSRSRLFVSFAAPGCQPLQHPQLSHSHPAHVQSRGLGRLANGQSFGQRVHGPTPFEYVTSADGTKGLPDIGDGQTYHCIPYPDHVMSIKPSKDLWLQMRVIPLHPRGSTFATAWNDGNGVLTKEQRALFPDLTKSGKTRQCVQKGSKAWGRVHPRRLFPTIVVSVYPMDARMGTCLHWDQQRMTTVMEARRAQGFPDDEVLVGCPAEKWKVIGNSVPRTVSLALGLSLRDAWLNNTPDKKAKGIETAAKAVLPRTQSKSRTHRVSHPGQIRQPIAAGSNKTLNAEVFPGSNAGRLLGPLPLRSTACHNPGPTEVVDRHSFSAQQAPPERPHGAPKETRILPLEKSLKRRHSTLQETRIVPPEKSYKSPRLSATTSGLSTPATDPGPRTSKLMGGQRGPTAQPVKVSGLRTVVNRHVAQKVEDHFADDESQEQHSKSMADGDDKDEMDVSIFASVVSKL